MKHYKYKAGYKDKAGVEKHIKFESRALFTQSRREFTNECHLNGWEFLYFKLDDENGGLL